MSKRKIFKTNPIRKYIIISLFVFLFFGIGYSILGNTLNIQGNIDIDSYDNTLYGVLEKAARKGTYAKEYTQSHHDSFTEEPTKKVYHIYSNNTLMAEETLNKNNVIFAGYCWQIYRTTDTGGTRIIYNGVPNNGKCNNAGADQQIGTSLFNASSKSLADVGYMYNKRYEPSRKNSIVEYPVTNYPFDLSWWFSDTVTWDSTRGTYSLDNPFQLTNKDDYQTIINAYTFSSSDINTTSSGAEYITEANSSYIYYFKVYNGDSVEDYNDTYTYGNNYIDNNNGTYTIENPTTVTRINFERNNNYLNMANKYMCKNAVNNTCSDLWHTNNTTHISISYHSINNTYKFANNFTYENGIYKLNNNNINLWDLSREINNMKTNHYTCWNETGECNEISFIYYQSDSGTTNYINLENGKSIEDAKNEMLYNDDINTYDSPIKTYIENWYRDNLISYGNYIEDTIFCYDRSQLNKDTNGWSINGSFTTNFTFGGSTDLTCPNQTDQFSMNNNKARITYPIGLMSNREAYFMDSSLKITGRDYWLGSPSIQNAYNDYLLVKTIDRYGTINGYSTIGSYGVRPVISLKPGIEYSSGKGSKDNPYIVDTN